MNPWDNARVHGRDYLTPEDIQAAINSGIAKVELQQTVLEAIGRCLCEDASACAYVAASFKVVDA
jgi:histone H3/H4